MSGHWPPEWEDPDDGHSDAGLPDDRQLDAGHPELDLSEVTAFLASVPSPDLPPSFEARISAAIAAEAAARATITRADATEPAGPPIAVAGADDEKSTVRSENQKEFSPIGTAGVSPTSTNRRLRRISRASRSAAGAAGAAGPGHPRPDGRRRRLRMPSAQASGWLAVCCLVIAGFGYLFAHASDSSSSSSVASSAAGAAVGSAGKSAHEQHNTLEPAPSSSASAATGFTFIESGTSYQRSTLEGLVRRVTNAVTFGTVTPASSAPASTPASAAESVPSAAASSADRTSYEASPALTGCVLRLTGEVTPSLVDRASYDGTPAYIIAVPSHVWVVRLGCTATDPQLITQAPLKG
jgi:hypothetical protein